jgi:phosphohistidine phosphatase
MLQLGTMKTLLLMRHAKSSRDDPSLSDHDRPLNERGKLDAPRMGRLLRNEGLTPDLIISSSATRALATAGAVGEECNYSETVGVRVAPELYPGDTPSYVGVLREISEEFHRVLVVGHNPAIETFLSELVEADEDLPTSAVAVVQLPIERWEKFPAKPRGVLKTVWRPRDID